MLIHNARCLFIQNAPSSSLRLSTAVTKVQSILGSNKITTNYICNFLDENNVHFSKLESILSKFMRYSLGQDINKLIHYPIYLKSVLNVSTYLTDLDHDIYSKNSLHEESNLFKTVCSNIHSCDEAKFDVLDKDLSDLVFSGVWRISMGPSSSHFTGVYNAASNYRKFLKEQNFNFTQINVFLHDSMQLGSAGTGFGHDTHKAIRAGLNNIDLVQENYDDIFSTDSITRSNTYSPSFYTFKSNSIEVKLFDAPHLLFNKLINSKIPNGLMFIAENEKGGLLGKKYWSTGGGDIKLENRMSQSHKGPKLFSELLEPNSRDLLLDTWFKNEMTNVIQLNSDTPNFKLSDAKDIWITQFKSILQTLFFIENTSVSEDSIYSISPNLSRYLPRNSYYYNVQKIGELNALGYESLLIPTKGSGSIVPALMLKVIQNENVSLHSLLDKINDQSFDNIINYKGEDKNLNCTKNLMEFVISSTQVGILAKYLSSTSAATGGCSAEMGWAAAIGLTGNLFVRGGSTSQIAAGIQYTLNAYNQLSCTPAQGRVVDPCISRNLIGYDFVLKMTEYILAHDYSEFNVATLDNTVERVSNQNFSMPQIYKERYDIDQLINRDY